jgi:glycogen(starch) synthase
MTTADLTFSLVVNTIDRAEALRTLLRALEHQSYPQFEVIVVVGPTHDHTLDVLAEYADRVQVLRCPTANLGQSRNIGLAAARGDIVAFIDDDAVPCVNWLAQLARLFADPYLAATGGSVYLVHPDVPVLQHRLGIASAMAEQVDVRVSWLDQIVPEGQSTWWVGRMMGTNMAFRRRALLDIGGFDEYFRWVFDDTDVCLRLMAAGHVVQPVSEAMVYHIPASSRNRVAFSFNVKFWIQTQAAVYFAIKQGLAAGDTRRAVALRCLHLVHGHWLWAGQLRSARLLTFRLFLRMRFREVQHGLLGARQGLFAPRRLLNSTDRSNMPDTLATLQPFQNEHSATQSAVNPIDGTRPSVTLLDTPLRVCLLSSAYPPRQMEGVGRHTNLMAQGLFECGHTVHVITRGEKDQVSYYDGAYVHQLAQRRGRYERYRHLNDLYHSLNHSHAVFEEVKRLQLNDGIQVVDSPVWLIEGLVTATSGVAPVVARLQTARKQIAALQKFRDDDSRLIGEMEQALIERAAYLVPNSQATVEAAARVYGAAMSPNRYTIIPHGIVPVSDEAVQPFDLQHPPHTFTVLYVGRLEKRKGIADLFAAIPRVLQKIPNVRFIIAGGDNSHADGFINRTGLTYPAYFSSKRPQLAAQVEFTGAVSDEDLQRLYQTCDLFVAPSLYESFGLIYLEAMNYAKPVIGCRAGGIPEVVDHGVSGLLVDPESPIALAEAITSLLSAPVKLRELGLAGRQRLLDRFTHIQMARRFAEVYRTVIQAAARPE